MPIQLKEENGGKTLAVHVSGKLVKADYADFVPAFDRLVLRRGKVRVLLDMSAFQGWDAAAVWEDFKVDVKHFNDIDRLAMVGEKRWQEWMATICRPFTTATVKYFDHAQADEARKWLNAKMTDSVAPETNELPRQR